MAGFLLIRLNQCVVRSDEVIQMDAACLAMCLAFERRLALVPIVVDNI